MLPTAREPPTRRRLLRRGLDLLGSFQGDVSSFLDQLDPGGATWPLPHGAGDLTATSPSSLGSMRQVLGGGSAHGEVDTLGSSDGISRTIVKPHGGDIVLLSRVTTSFTTLHDDLDATLRGLADLVSESRQRQRRSAGQSTATTSIQPSLAQASSRQATTSPAADSARPSSLSAVWDVPPFPLPPLPQSLSSMAGNYEPGSRSAFAGSRSDMPSDYDYVLLEAAHEELRALGVDVVREAAATSAAAARLRAQSALASAASGALRQQAWKRVRGGGEKGGGRQSAQASASSGALRQQAWKRVRCSDGCDGQCSLPRPRQHRGHCGSKPGQLFADVKPHRLGVCRSRRGPTRGTPPSLQVVHPPKHTSLLHMRWRAAHVCCS